MRIPGSGRLRRWVRRMGRRSAPGVVVLAYHRVAETPTGIRSLCVTPQHFREQMEILSKLSVVVRLADLPAVLESRWSFRRAVAVTFDDGYADNLYVAKPLLERFGVPATVFITTGYIGGYKQFWVDVLEAAILGQSTLPSVFSLSVGGRVHRWTLDGAANGSAKPRAGARTRNLSHDVPVGSRQSVFAELHELLRPCPDAERRRAARAVAGLVGWRPTADDIGLARVMSEHEIVRLAAGGLVEIGAHTVTHPVLAMLSERRQRSEIVRSKRRLEAILGRRVTSFAYPYGSKTDYSLQTVELVRELGFERACAFFEGLVQPRTDPYQLPRCGVGDWDGEQFERRVRTWFGMWWDGG